MTKNEIEFQDVCGGCGHPPFAGHAQNCPAVKKEGEVENVFQVEEAITADDRRKFFEFFHREYGFDSEHARRAADLSVKYFDRSGSPLRDKLERRTFAIYDDEKNIIAGAELFIGEKDGRKEAYFGHKVVAGQYRGQEVGHLLVVRRLEIARERGCQEAYSLVERENVAALRSVTKDGFLIKGNGMTKTGNEVSRDTYYASRDLTRDPEKAHAIEEIGNTKQVGGVEQLQDNEVLVPIGNADLIDKAFQEGYIGLQVVLPKDTKVISEPMLYMEKSKIGG